MPTVIPPPEAADLQLDLAKEYAYAEHDAGVRQSLKIELRLRLIRRLAAAEADRDRLLAALKLARKKIALEYGVEPGEAHDSVDEIDTALAGSAAIPTPKE